MNTQERNGQLHGDMDYGAMARLLAAKYALSPWDVARVHGKWKAMGKGARSPLWMIGAKYI